MSEDVAWAGAGLSGTQADCEDSSVPALTHTGRLSGFLPRWEPSFLWLLGTSSVSFPFQLFAGTSGLLVCPFGCDQRLRVPQVCDFATWCLLLRVLE